jgi:hypothetical protein
MIKKSFIPITFIFLIVIISFIVLKGVLKNSGNVLNALVAGNLVLYVATYFSFNFYLKAINNDSTQAFLRLVYSAMISKMLICIAATLAYAFMITPVSKAAVLIFFGLYFIYTFAEIKIIMRLNKEKKNA